MARFVLFLTAVSVLYIGGFVYDEVGPLLYAVILAIIASTPLLFKYSFWKKLLFMVPLIVLRVIGKVFLTVFGKNALSKLLARYGLLEQRFNQTLKAVGIAKDQGIARWMRMSRPSQAYLLLIFLPVGIVVFLLMLIIKFVRLKFLQFIIEKTMQTYLMRWTVDSKSAAQVEEARRGDEVAQDSVRVSEHATKQMLDEALEPEHPPEPPPDEPLLEHPPEPPPDEPLLEHPPEPLPEEPLPEHPPEPPPEQSPEQGRDEGQKRG